MVDGVQIDVQPAERYSIVYVNTRAAVDDVKTIQGTSGIMSFEYIVSASQTVFVGAEYQDRTHVQP